MICEECGAEMNHHADKVDYNAGLDDPALIDPVFDGVLEEAHCCPACGWLAVKPVAPADSRVGR